MPMPIDLEKAYAMTKRMLLTAFAAGMLISCTSAPSLGHADDLAGSMEAGPLTVMVLGEDAHPNLVPRDDPSFRRVLSELQSMMDRRGFRVVDEAAIAADMGWGWRGGLDRAGVLELAKLANASEMAGNRSRAAVVFRIEATIRDLSYTSRVDLHLSGEIYDIRSNRYLGGFDLPTESVSTPGRCASSLCVSDVVGTRARDLASDLGAVLAEKLAHLADPDDLVLSRADRLEDVYTVTMRHLPTEDAMSILSVMTEEFPGYRSHEMIRGGNQVRRYEYVTTASSSKIERWLTLLLLDMGLDPERDVVLMMRNGDIVIDQVRR